MEKLRYMISDAAHLVNVESHVLRYWEDELDLEIPRNEMGHRYYTKENIQDFQRIKDLKDQGYQLKAIRMILHNGNVEEFVPLKTGEQVESAVLSEQPPAVAAARSVSESQAGQAATSAAVVARSKFAAPQPDAEDRMAQFRELMSDIVGRAIAANNEELSQWISTEVGERVLKEMDYLFREQEDAQEERFRKLDAAIRQSVHGKKPLFRKRKEKAAKADKNAKLKPE